MENFFVVEIEKGVWHAGGISERTIVLENAERFYEENAAKEKAIFMKLLGYKRSRVAKICKTENLLTEEIEGIIEKFWVTKFSLDRGIFFGFENPVRVALLPDSESDYWHKTKQSAIEHAEKMRKNEIDSLKKNIDVLEMDIKKLQSLKFE